MTMADELKRRMGVGPRLVEWTVCPQQLRDPRQLLLSLERKLELSKAVGKPGPVVIQCQVTGETTMPDYKKRRIELIPNRRTDWTWQCSYIIIEFRPTCWAYHK